MRRLTAFGLVLLMLLSGCAGETAQTNPAPVVERQGIVQEPAQTVRRTTGGDRDCADFASQREAQAFLEQSGPGDPHRLDRDDDGLACEAL